ncbi:MAG: carboxylesterase family protein [Propionicimonas sp.]|uniref:carboxylesterase/lipase family protein n=1 Tax=Propionicimonas sp. TaxID=1955623 RepID=UPI003D09A243
MSTAVTDRPVVQTTSGAVRGVWRGPSAAFLGVPFAQPPVGDLRFAAPVAALPWAGVRDASEPGPTPQRRPFGAVTTIPEPSIPGDATLNVNVFTPAPGEGAGLPVLVWIHGGGFFAGSPSSPWYDGRAYNRDGVVTVSLSYRLGFDGFGWIADAPTNRGVRDLLLGLEWVRDNIAAFGGDPGRVTISGQSAGGSAVMALLACPAAQGLFGGVIAHSGAGLSQPLARAEEIGRAFAERTGVAPTRAGWSSLSEDEVLDAQAAFMAPSGPPPATPAEYVATTLASRGVGLPFVPLTGDDVLPTGIDEAIASGVGAEVALLAGTVAHEFTMVTGEFAQAWADADPVRALTEGGLSAGVAAGYVAAHPELTTPAFQLGQLATDLSFRIPTLASADARGAGTWVYDFRWPSPVLGLSFHCLDLPFAWDLLDAEGVAASAGPQPPQALADEMHAAWVRFIASGDPGWDEWDGHNPRVLGAAQADTYAATRLLAGALGG